jgi:predicted Zn-dependent protease with MMP-like domain
MGGMRIAPEQFEALAFEEAQAVLAQLPPDLRAEAETVLLAVEDRRAADREQQGFMTLGLYEGVPLVERHADSVLFTPDRVTLYRLPLQSLAHSEAELRQRVRQTLIHELGHFFGFDEDELRRRGWG